MKNIKKALILIVLIGLFVLGLRLTISGTGFVSALGALLFILSAISVAFYSSVIDL